MNKNMNNNWYLEYSPKQKSFHIDQMCNIANNNMNIIMRKMKPEYFIVAEAETYEEIRIICAYLQRENPEIFKQFKMEELIG